MKARKLLVALLTPVLALTVASCGGKGDSTTSSNANPASSTTSITNNVETITISAALASTAGTKVTVDARVLAVTTQHLLLGDSTGKIVVFLGNKSGNTNKVGDHLQVTGALEDRNGINQFGNTATIKTLTTAAPEVSETVVEWTATEVDAFVDKQTYGTYITVSGSLAISGNYYNLTVEGASKGVVSLAYLNSSLSSKVSSGKSYKITGYAMYLSGGKYVNVYTTAVEEITSGGDTGGDTGGNTGGDVETPVEGTKETFTWAADTGTLDNNVLTFSSDNFNFTLDKAGSNTDTVNTYKELRFYTGATLTIAGKAGQSIKSVVFNTAFADKTASCAPSAATTKDGAADLSKVKETVDTTNLVVSYTFVDLGGVTSVTFTASKQLKISSIVITYGE